MAIVNKLADVRAWQEARKLVKSIYKLTGTEDFAKDPGLRDQVQRAALAAMTNIAQGFDSDSKLEFTRFLVKARRAALEVQSLLYAALDVGYITQRVFKAEYQQAEKIKVIVSGLKRSLKAREQKTGTSDT